MQEALPRHEIALMRVAYKLSIKDIDTMIKETRLQAEVVFGDGAGQKLISFRNAYEMLAKAREVSFFHMKFEDFPTPKGSAVSSFRIGVLPNDSFWKEVERIFTLNGVESVLPSGINTRDCSPPKEMSEIQDSWLLHQMYMGDSPRPKNAIALPLAIWTDEVVMTKSGKKIRVVVVRVLNINRDNMEKVGMKIILAAFPDFGLAAKTKNERGYVRTVIFNHCLKYALDPLLRVERGEGELPLLNLGGHSVHVWPYVHEVSADLKEQHELFGTYMSLNSSTNRPIPNLNVMVYQPNSTSSMRSCERMSL